MQLGLYTSQTFYSDSCLDFYGYYCYEYSTCIQNYSNPFSVDYVQFSVTGHIIQAPMYLDYTYWENKNQIGFATSCSTFTTMPFAPARYGLLALGLNGTENNFLASKVFSLNLNVSSLKGSLVFGSASAPPSSYIQVATISTNSNWQIPNTVASLGVGETEFAVSTTVIFDLNSNMIGLPTAVYNSLLKSFQKNTSTLCSASSSGPICPYSGYTANLPNITLTIQNQAIPIPPQIYLNGFTGYNPNNNNYYSLQLNIRELNSSMVNESYVTPGYENNIILDSNFMNYYMTLFDGSGYANNEFTVSLYASPANYIPPRPTPTPTPPGPNPSPDHTWIYIVSGVVGFIILIGIIVCVVRVVRKKRAMQPSVDQGFSREEPLMTAQQQNMPYQPYQNYQNIQNNMPAPTQMGYNQNYNQGYYDNQQQYYPQDYAKNQGYSS